MILFKFKSSRFLDLWRVYSVSIAKNMLGQISGSSRRMETQLCAYRAIVWLQKRPTKDHVHDGCHRINQFELSKSNEERRISKWNRIVHKLLYPRVSELDKKWTTVYSGLVNGIEPIDGRWFIQRTNRQIHQVLEMAENEKGKQRILLAFFSMHFKDHGC